MIRPDQKLEIVELPLSELSVWEHQLRYPERAMHYVRLMLEDSAGRPGFVLVRPREGRYEVLDGHHRFVAHILTGRTHVLCIVIHD